MGLKEIDLNRLDLFMEGDPFAAWKILCERAPVHWNPKDGTDYWSITRYHDAGELLALDFAVHQRADQIVAGVPPSLANHVDRSN
jgi:hypothetical protein